MKSCPNCGFDLNSDGTCSVCGYGSTTNNASAEEQERHSAGPPAGADKAKSRAPLIISITAACVIIVVAAVLVAIHTSRAGSTTLAGTNPAVSANAPKSSPARASALSKSEVSLPSAAVAQQTTSGPNGPTATTSAVKPAASRAGASTIVSYDPARFDNNPLYHVPVGASPVSLRATKPINLYIPAHEPAFDIGKRTQFPPLTSEQAFVSWMLAHTRQSAHFLQWRWQRAQTIVRLHLITKRRVLMAFLLTPREWFVRNYNLDKTYANTAIPIGFGQTISGPELVAHMTNALDPQPNQRVLEIGTGSGYQSAVLSELSNYVYTIEIVKPLAEQTNEIYLEHTKAEPQYANIHRRAADGYYGWPKYAPFDRIIVTTGIDHIPPILLQELKPGGIMLIPIGPPTGQVVLKITKTIGKDGRIHLTRSDVYHTPGGHREIFVPFTASGGGTHNLGNAAVPR